MTSGFRAIAAGPHVAPTTQAVLGAVEEDAMTTRVGAAPNACEFFRDECFCCRLDDGDHQSREGIAGGHKGARPHAIGRLFEAARTGTAAEHTIDLHHGVIAHPLGVRAAFGQCTESGPHTTRVDERRSGGGRLQHGATTNAGGPLAIDGVGTLQPGQQGFEIAQQITARRLRGGVGVHEIEPESRAWRRHGRRTARHIGPSRISGGDGHMVVTVRGRLLAYVAASKRIALFPVT